jgi:flagellar L-ring protein precursor FlgH
MKFMGGRLGAVCLLCWAWAAAAGAESLSGTGSLFASERTYQEGDLVTVVVSETAAGAQSASTDLNKETQLGLTTGGALGTVLGSANAGLSSQHRGGGALARAGRMSAALTAKVQKVLPNGCLVLAGVQEIAFDSGVQRISVQGTARPRDISPGNEILSTRLSDAKIEYLGADALNEKARTGFLGRFLEWLWIF